MSYDTLDENLTKVDLIKDINLNKLFIVENADGKLEIIKDEGITIE